MSDTPELCGRQLDKAVAEAFGWTHVSPVVFCGYEPGYADPDWPAVPPGWPPRIGPKPIPKYSTDVAAAWLVVDALRKRFTNFTVTAANGWSAIAWDVRLAGEHVNVHSANGETAPEAICRLAVLAAHHLAPEPGRE